MLFKSILIGLLALTSIPSYSCNESGTEGILPNHNTRIELNSKAALSSNLDEADFNEVIDKVVAIYKPIFKEMGGKLVVERGWEDGTVNAYAKRDGDNWIIRMFGGLARHEAVTHDGFALVVCHELGHHIGGAPKKTDWWGGTRWATNEGQADYFATLKCLRKVFEAENNAKALKDIEVPQVVVEKCADQFSNKEEQRICQRGSMAGMSVAKLFQSLRDQEESPKFTTPDSKRVAATKHSHPATQCRLDTYYQGALCTVDAYTDVDQKDEEVGTCLRSEGDRDGIRPRCWFKPASELSRY